MSEPQGVDALAAALRADVGDLDVYARVLTTALADALPAGMVVVERDRSLADRLSGKDGRVRALHVMLGNRELSLTRGRSGEPEALFRQRVHGVVIASKQIPMDEWVRQLATGLAERASENAAARAALGRLLGQE